jgi:TolB-like protein
MRKILSSDEFDATEQQRNFFTFVVTETLAGRQQTIKGYTIATQVFGRAPDFNASMDPIVSMQANKLRRSLERYYLLVGYRDPVRIDIPKGGYVPTFNEQSIVEPNARLNEEVMRTDLMVSWPSVLVLPFKNMTESPSKDFLGIGFSTELAVEIARFQEITVLFPLEGEIETVSANKYRFVLGGIIYEHGNTIKIIAHMIDTRTGEQIWGDSHKSNLDTGGFYAFQEKVVPVIAAKIGGEVGVIPKLLAIESRTKAPIELSTYEAILRFYEYEQTLAPENFLRAMEALKQARNADPECDQIWSLLARLYGIIYSLDISGFENPLEKAVAYAEKGVHMNPNNQRNVAILAYIRFFSNELSAAIINADRALELNPNSLFMLDGLAIIIMLSGEWERGAALARKSIRRNPYHRSVVHDALWVDYLRQGDYDLAYIETMSRRRPASFWYHLAKASTLGLLGRIEEGKKYSEHLLRLRPDFPRKGRMLIRHYIKFEEIVRRIVDGLGAAGLRIE